MATFGDELSINGNYRSNFSLYKEIPAMMGFPAVFMAGRMAMKGGWESVTKNLREIDIEDMDQHDDLAMSLNELNDLNGYSPELLHHLFRQKLVLNQWIPVDEMR